MQLSEKITALRKSRGYSQEELAGQLEVSRQAVSKWEMGSAKPDVDNILRLSQIFGVSTDYLLNDAWETPEPPSAETAPARADNSRQILFYMVLLELMVMLLQVIAVEVLQSALFGLLSFLPFLAAIGGFEYAYQKNGGASNERARTYRRRFYKISAWLGLFFPIQMLMEYLAHFYPWPYSALVFQCVTLCVYLGAAGLICLELDRRG